MIRSSGSNDFDWSQLAAWFAGELSGDSAVRLEAWVAADPKRQAEVDRLRALWESAGRSAQGWDARAALRSVKQAAARSALDGRGAGRPSAPPPRHFSLPHSGWWVSLAAAVLVLVSGAAGAWLLRGRAEPTAESAESMAVLSTPRGQRARLTLPDGSRVLLGPASTLQYSARGFAASRELFLDGDAYFDVVHDAARPLRVISSRGTTEDVGTAFAVSDHGEAAFRVVVAEGSVMLRLPAAAPTGAPVGDSLLLGQADLAQVGSDGRLVHRRNVDVESYLAWREGRLVFRGTPLREVLYRLSIWYDLDVELGDSALADRPFTATFEHETSEQVLRVLAVALGVRYEHRGALLLVLPEHSAAAGRP